MYEPQLNPPIYTISALDDSEEQKGPPLSEFKPLEVMVIDNASNPQGPAKNVHVTFQVADSTLPGAPQVRKDASDTWKHAVTVGTSPQGHASVQARAMQASGVFRVIAQVQEGTANHAEFRLTVDGNADVSSQVAQLKLVSGDGQTALAGDKDFGDPLVVRALDAGGTKVAGAKVSFVVQPAGSATLMTAVPVTTNSDGDAIVRLTPGASAGKLSVAASCNGQTVAFQLVLVLAEDLVIGTSRVLVVPTRRFDVFDVLVRGKGGETYPSLPFQATIVGSGFIFDGNQTTTGRLTTGPDGRVSLTIRSLSPGAMGSLVVEIGSKKRQAFPLHTKAE